MRNIVVAMMVAGLSVPAFAGSPAQQVPQNGPIDQIIVEQPDDMENFPEIRSCEALEVAYDFGPGGLKCNRNWSKATCFESTVGTVLCNIVVEPAGNIVKLPLNMVEEGIKMGVGAASDVWDEAPGVLKVLAAPALLVGGMAGILKGTVEGAVGTVVAVVEISGDEAVVNLTTFESAAIEEDECTDGPFLCYEG